MKMRALTIRQSLIAVQVVGILGLGSLLFATTFVGARDTVGELLDEMMRRTMDHVVRELYSFFGRTGQAQEMASEWIESGVLDTSDRDAVHRLGRSLLQIHPELSAFVLVTDEGESHRVDRTEEGWQDVLVRPDRTGGFRRSVLQKRFQKRFHPNGLVLRLPHPSGKRLAPSRHPTGPPFGGQHPERPLRRSKFIV